MKTINQERGSEYGHCLHHFDTSQALQNIWDLHLEHMTALRPTRLCKHHENAMRHAVAMILDKLVRAAYSPLQKDHWDDIEGYARCAKIALGMEKYGNSLDGQVGGLSAVEFNEKKQNAGATAGVFRLPS